jgi:hypothetical protein
VIVFLFCGITHAGLSDGLVAYYPFNGNANDESGNGNNGTVNGATLIVDRFGNANKAYSFDGNDIIRISNNDSLNFGTSDFSMSLWIKPNSEYCQIIGKDVFPGGLLGYYLSIGAAGTRKLRFATRNVSDNTLDSPNPLPNEWTYIVAVRKSNILKLYINGTLDSSLSESSTTNVSSNADFKIGRFDEWIGVQSSFYGNIDDIRIYNRALSETEIQQLYQGQGTCSTNVVTFTAGTPAKAADVNANFDVLNCQIQALKAIVCKNEPTASVCQ